MSQKNETTILLLTLLITLSLVGIGALFFGKFYRSEQENITRVNSNSQQISFGEKTLISGQLSPEKQAGLEAIASKNWIAAVSKLQQALKVDRNDPETLIFLNNARIGDQKSYLIAASVPMGSDLNGSLEILRGIAQAQDEINKSGGINGVPLQVAIANDDNNPEIAKQIASALVNNSDVLGVIGPYASDVTLAAGTIYDSGRLVAISPISTSVKVSGFSPYVLRTVPSDYVAARALADYMLNTLKQRNAAVFFNSQSAYSQSLKSEFVTAVSLGGGQVSSELDLSSPSFSAAKSVTEAIAQGAQLLMLAANTSTLDKALQVVQVNRKQVSLLGGDDVYAPKTLEVGGEAAVGMVVAIPWDIDKDPNSTFVSQSRQLWGADVNWRTAMAYDASVALIAGIKSNPTRNGVQQALSSSNFSVRGASNTVRFLPSGDRNAPVQLVKIIPSSHFTSGYDFVPVTK